MDKERAKSVVEYFSNLAPKRVGQSMGTYTKGDYILGLTN